MPLGSKISFLCSVASLRVYAELFNVGVALIGLLADDKGLVGGWGGRDSLCHHRGHSRGEQGRGRANGANGDSLAKLK